MEIWKNIENYPDYMVSSMGRVKSLKQGKERLLKLNKCNNGYLKVTLSDKKEIKQFKVHRLVAQAFIDNSNNKEFIDHINTIKTDNRVENLRWVTRTENNNNPLTVEKYTKPIIQLNKDMELVKIWKSAREIEKKLGFDHSNIAQACKKEKIKYGYLWGYANDYERLPFKVFKLDIYVKRKVA